MFRRVALASLALAACGDDAAQLTAPRLEADWVLVASAGGGRALVPGDISIKRATELSTLTIPGAGNVTVDMLYAGLRDEDMPAGLSPDAIVFKTSNDAYTRAIPPLVVPHVLEIPSPPGSEGTLVPVEELGLSDEELRYRKERFDALVKDLRILDPCELSDAEFKTPRIPATAAFTARVIEGAGVYIGFAATGTAILGRFDRDPARTELVGIDMGETSVMPGEATAATAFGSETVMGPDGKSRPKLVTIHRGGAIGHIADYRVSKYADDTPRELDPPIGRPEFARTLDFDGDGRLCVGGSAQGQGTVGSGAKLAGIWCRTSTGGAWNVETTLVNAVRVTRLLEPPGFRALAIDYSGTVYGRSSAGRWDELVRPAINQDCGAVACNRLDITTELPAGAPALAVTAGDDGEAWSIAGDSARTLSSTKLDAVAKALFADEKKGALKPIMFTAATTAPDGAVWLATDAHFTLRVAPDLGSATRVCHLPSEHPVTAMATAEDGRLILVTSPVTIGVGTWRR